MCRARQLLSALITLVSIAGTAFAGDPTRIPSDHPAALGDGPNAPTFVPDFLTTPRQPVPLTAGPAGQLGSLALPAIQSETSAAVSGSNVVVGYNDARGNFGLGIMFSTDGGATFSDAGQLAVPPGSFSIGDPALGVWTPPSGSPVFYCATINTDASNLSAIFLYRSTTGGATWSGPFMIGSSQGFPDREAMAVDPETGRVLISWTNYGSFVAIAVTYSDDAATADPPTWSTADLVGARFEDGQATTIVADPNSDNVYLGWMTFPAIAGGDRGIATAVSNDNGTSWSGPHDLSPNFYAYQCPYGFDRWLWSFSGSSLALNPADGGLEVVYAASVDGTPSSDFGDIYYRRSVDGGLNWTSPVALNVFPGAGRPQCLPAVSAAANGRIDVYWYDLSAGSGLDDWTDIFHTFSKDFGGSWSSPVPITPSPFHNESGNNFGAPQQGDYLDAVTGLGVGGASFGAYATFADPSAVTTGADGLAFAATGVQVAPLRVRPGSVIVRDHGCAANDGVLVAKETAELTIPLENIGRVAMTAVSATLSAMTPGVTVQPGARVYGTIASGASGSEVNVYRVTLGAGYPCGTPCRFRLDINATGVAPAYVEFSLPTGVPVAQTTLLSENFDGVVAPALPAGWSAVTVRGSPPNPWVTSATSPASSPNAAFDPEAGTNNFERLQGPVLAVPSGSSYVEVTFDTQYNLFQYTSRYAPNGFTFDYQLDGTGGSHFSVGDATEFSNRYTHNIARSSGSAGDRSGWSGTAMPYRHVRIVIPGLAGHTLIPRFHVTTVGGGTIAGHGAWLDNVSIQAVTLGCGACVDSSLLSVPASGAIALRLGNAVPNPVRTQTTFSLTVPHTGAASVTILDVRGRIIATLVDRWLTAGVHDVSWDGRDSAGHRVATGMYFCRVRLGREEVARPLVVLR